MLLKSKDEDERTKILKKQLKDLENQKADMALHMGVSPLSGFLLNDGKDIPKQKISFLRKIFFQLFGIPYEQDRKTK